MKRHVGTLVGLLALPATSLGAQQSVAHYAPLEFLVGSCWTGTFPGGSIADTHCFEWMYDRKFVRDRHVVSSTPKYEGETIYAWDPATKAVVFRYLSNDGLFLNGTVEQHGDSLVFPSQYPDDKGHQTEVRSVWIRQGQSAYRAMQFQRDGGVWKPALDVVYRRTP